MKYIIFLCVFFLSGCLFGFEAFFPNMYHKCSSLSSWCVNEPTREIMFWNTKDPKYKVSENCCSKKWDEEITRKNRHIAFIFEQCKVDPKTGESLVGESKDDVFSCLEKNGLYRYSSKR